MSVSDGPISAWVPHPSLALALSCYHFSRSATRGNESLGSTAELKAAACIILSPNKPPRHAGTMPPPQPEGEIQNLATTPVGGAALNPGIPAAGIAPPYETEGACALPDETEGAGGRKPRLARRPLQKCRQDAPCEKAKQWFGLICVCR